MATFPQTSRVARVRARLTVDERQFRTLTYIALGALTLIVFTGAAVRLSDSGLGCSTWPRCTAGSTGHLYPSLSIHPLIEFSNRAISSLVGVMCAVIAIAALTRKPFRRDLAWLAWSLPLGVAGQAFLGGYTVKADLAPGFVMSHFLLSMVILIFAVALAWRATHEPGSLERNPDRLVVWTTRVAAVFCALTLVAGTAATAAGPHSGGSIGQDHFIKRLTIKGPDTLEWAVNNHGIAATLFGILVIGIWFLKRRRGQVFDPAEPITLLGVMLAGQGLLGAVQYELKLPAGMVWIHVAMATVTWVVTLWAVCVESYVMPLRPPYGGAGAGASPGVGEGAVGVPPQHRVTAGSRA
jgi:cytochrome c oxidase assembly protein subunit 15